MATSYKQGSTASMYDPTTGAYLGQLGLQGQQNFAGVYSQDASGNVTGLAGPSGLLLPTKYYLGLVATRGSFPSAGGSGAQQIMSRTKHVATDNISSLQVVYANSYVQNNGVETASGGVGTYTASIEYPIGTITRVTFSGFYTGTIASGGLLVSDSVIVTIPKGAAFYVRTWQSNSAFAVYNNKYGLNNVTGSVPNSGEWWAFGTTTTDLTNSTTNSNNQQSGIIFLPTAIIGMTSRPSFYLAGDSRLSNNVTYDASPNGFGGSGEVERYVAKNYASFNAGSAGETLVNAATGSYTMRFALAKYCSNVICGYGGNDLIAGNSLVTILANLATFANKFSGKPFYQTTLSPYTTSTDLWATTINQTAVASESVRVSLNNAIRQGLGAPISGYIETADNSESARDSGKWKVTGSANGYTSDGIHGNAALNYLIETGSAPLNLPNT